MAMTNGNAPQKNCPVRSGCRLTRRRLTGWGSSKFVRRRELHEFVGEAEFDVGLVAGNVSRRIFDPDGVGRGRGLPQQTVVEGEFAHQIHRLGQGRTVGEGDRIGRIIEHLRRRQLMVEARQVGARIRRHLLAGGLGGGIAPRHPAHHFVPGAGQRHGQLGIVLDGLGLHHHQIDDLARDLRGIEDLSASGFFRTSLTCGFQVTTAPTSPVLKAATISASEVFTRVRSRSLRWTVSSPRASRYCEQESSTRFTLRAAISANFGWSVALLRLRMTASLTLEKSPTMIAVVSTPPAAGIVKPSILVSTTPSKLPAVYWLIDST